MLLGIDAILVVVILTNLLVLGSSRVAICIRSVALQGILLGVLTFHDAYHSGQTGVIRKLLGRPPADL